MKFYIKILKMKINSRLKLLNKDTANCKNIKKCPISVASTEIMLYRICNGYKLEFPFLNS